METVITRITRWMVVFALMLSYWPFGQAQASVPKMQPWRAPAIVGFEKALYTANFDWKGSAGYQFEIGTRKYKTGDAGKSRFVALIMKGGQRLATCERQLQGESPFNTHALLLRCEGKMFNPASGYVRFEFGPYPSIPGLMVWTGPRTVAQHVVLHRIDSGSQKVVTTF